MKPFTLERLKSGWANLGLSLVLSAFVSAGISNYVTYTKDMKVQAYIAKTSRVMQFTASGDVLFALVGDYIRAVTSEGDVASVQAQMRSEIAKEMRLTDDLKTMFAKDYHLRIDAYQMALQEFGKTIPQATSPTSMRPWVEGFGRVFDSRAQLSTSLIHAVELNS